MDPWRNGSASDSRSEGCVFDSRRVQFPAVVFVLGSSFLFNHGNLFIPITKKKKIDLNNPILRVKLAK